MESDFATSVTPQNFEMGSKNEIFRDPNDATKHGEQDSFMSSIMKLPNDIKMNISKYICNPQPKKVLLDIKHYYISKIFLFDNAIKTYKQYNGINYEDINTDIPIVSLIEIIIQEMYYILKFEKEKNPISRKMYRVLDNKYIMNKNKVLKIWKFLPYHIRNVIIRGQENYLSILEDITDPRSAIHYYLSHISLSNE